MTQVCVIFGAGEYYAGTPVVPAGAYVIAADGGLDHTRQLGIVPDVVVGDFDSLEGRPPRQLMALLARHGASGYLYGDGLIVTAITDGRLSFPAHPVPEDGRMVSAFSHSDVSLGVNEPGLKYELKDGTLTNTVVQGVSNEFRDGVDAAISVEHGTLIVTFPIEVALPQVSRFHEFGGDIGELDTAVSKLLVR